MPTQAKDTTGKTYDPLQDIKRKEKYRRYYLQRRLRANNIKYSSRHKTIELCDNEKADIELMKQKVERVRKYVHELYSKHNFVIEKVIMKAKNTKEKEEMFVPSTEALVKVEDLKNKFPDIQDKIKEYTEYSLAVKIETDDNLMAADNTSSEVHEVLKNVEKVRQVLKAPYFNTGKVIDEYAKTMTDPLEKAKKRINEEIARYRVIKAAMIKAEEDAKMREIAALEEEKREEMNKITRIEQQLTARTYGGVWITRDGQKMTSIGCVKESDCDDLITLIVTKVPKPESFKFYQAQAEEMLSKVRDRIAKHKINLHNLNGDSKILREDALVKINEAKVEAGVEAAETKEIIEKKIEKETKQQIKGFEKSIDQARKGVAQVLKFSVLEEHLVPREFLVVSEEKIRDYMRQNGEQIRTDLKDNKVSLPGIKFYIDDSYRSKA